MMKINYEDFPKKCIVCKEQVELEKFKYSISRRPLFRNKTTTYYTYFPVCSTCKKSLKSYTSLKNFVNWFLYYGGIGSIVLFFISFFLAFSGMMGSSLSSLFFITIILFIGSLLMSAILSFTSSIHSGKISRYISISKKGIVKLKDKDLQDEFSLNIEKNLIERFKAPDPSEAIECPKCNSLQKPGTDFCLNCGIISSLIIFDTSQ